MGSQQVALVTGGNRGLGLEVVRSILEQEARHFVVFGCRDLQFGRALADELRRTYGDRVEALQLDVADASSIKEAVKAFATNHQQLDILVNNAGILLEGDGAPFDIGAVRETVRVNFEGVVAVTGAFLPLLKASPGGGQVLSTSSGTATRALGLLSEEYRCALMETSLDLQVLRKVLGELVDGLQNPNDSNHCIPTVGYSLSKLGVNCYTQLLAREHPSMLVNACSPGFCNTGMCANYTGTRKPKAPALGASVLTKVLFGGLGQGVSGAFFKEASKPDTPVDKAVSVLEPWVALPEK